MAELRKNLEARLAEMKFCGDSPQRFRHPVVLVKAVHSIASYEKSDMESNKKSLIEFRRSFVILFVRLWTVV